MVNRECPMCGERFDRSIKEQQIAVHVEKCMMKPAVAEEKKKDRELEEQLKNYNQPMLIKRNSDGLKAMILEDASELSFQRAKAIQKMTN